MMSNFKPTVMKLQIKNLAPVTILLICVVFFSGCFKDEVTKTYSISRPVLKEKSEVLANIKSGPTHTLSSPGKIYLYGKYIFLNEMNKGVHVLDNSNPSNLTEVCFIDIPGNIDIAVKGSTLYADMFTDLLTIDITNPLQVKLSKVTPHSPVPEGPGKNISLSPFGYISHRAAEKFPSRIARNGCSRNPNIPQ